MAKLPDAEEFIVNLMGADPRKHTTRGILDLIILIERGATILRFDREGVLSPEENAILSSATRYLPRLYAELDRRYPPNSTHS